MGGERTKGNEGDEREMIPGKGLLRRRGRSRLLNGERRPSASLNTWRRRAVRGEAGSRWHAGIRMESGREGGAPPEVRSSSPEDRLPPNAPRNRC